MSTDKSKQRVREFTRRLFAAYKKHYRPMRWRNTHNPYNILVSEVMLQQTQVERVKQKYNEFIKRFPTVDMLAAAPLSEVILVWQGLGYNRRAKYLHDCAKTVVLKHGGKFPNSYQELVALPGIGMSTAAALLAFAFEHDEPMIDTNTRRILARIFFAGKPPRDKDLYHFARSIIPNGKGRDWNYAMLDVGALFCTARNHSNQCPFESMHGVVGDFTYKKPQSTFRHSRRYYRGRIIDLFRNQKHTTLQAVVSALPECKDVEDILADLHHDGLITIKGKYYSLAV